MKISIICSVLDSKESLRRQCLNWERIGICQGGDTEIIIVDDGSEIPITYSGPLPLKVLRREPILDREGKRRWTASAARNTGVKEARGEYLLCFDLDHIITKEILDTIRGYTGPRISLRREFGVLLEDGTLTQDKDVLLQYGLLEERYNKKGVRFGSHPNQYAMRRDVFFAIGGYNEHIVLTRTYPQGEDGLFKKGWLEYERKTGEHAHEYRPVLYMWPNGYYCGHVDYDQFGLFHNSTKVNDKNSFCKYNVRENPSAKKELINA